MADCLTLLRQYNTQKKEIIERDNLVLFEKIAWSQNAKTNFLVYKTGQTGGNKEYYTLESLLFLLKNVSLSHPMYVQRAGAQNIPVITLADRKEVLGYLNGEIETSSSIDKSVQLDMGIPAPAPKRPHDESNNEPAKKPRRDEDIQAEQKRLATILNQTGRSKGGAITDQIRSLGDAMSMEQIAAIKAKRLAKKRGTIKTDDLDDGTDHMYVDDTTSEIMGKERVHRTRATILQSSGKFNNIFSLLQSVKARDEGKGGEGPLEQPPKVVTKAPRSPTSPMQGYNRYGQEKYQKEGGIEGFNIVMTKSFVGMDLKSVTESVAKPNLQTNPAHSHPPQVALKKIGGVPVKKVDVKTGKADHKSRTPIVIVPSAVTSVLNILNIKDFLEDFKYVPPEEKKKAGIKMTNDVLINRKKKHPTVLGQTLSIPYKIVNNPLRLAQDEWQRVVAVFVAGPLWQFKGWPGLTNDGSPVDIFTSMKGFHLKFEGAALDPNIQRWDVHVLEINRLKRHLDKANGMRFWELVDKFIVKHKPELRY